MSICEGSLQNSSPFSGANFEFEDEKEAAEESHMANPRSLSISFANLSSSFSGDHSTFLLDEEMELDHKATQKDHNFLQKRYHFVFISLAAYLEFKVAK